METKLKIIEILQVTMVMLGQTSVRIWGPNSQTAFQVVLDSCPNLAPAQCDIIITIKYRNLS